MNSQDVLLIRTLQRQDYLSCWQRMQTFTNDRQPTTQDEIWFIEHDPVFTQGQNGKPEHILLPGDIPVIKTDRGGQVTYHGPGQLMVYTLIDIKRKQWQIREFVTRLEQTVIDLLASYGIAAIARRDAPGVYITQQKICSIGLRLRRGCAYHGMALNVAMDLAPFDRIHPCGFSGLKMTMLATLMPAIDLPTAAQHLINFLKQNLGYNGVVFDTAT